MATNTEIAAMKAELAELRLILSRMPKYTEAMEGAKLQAEEDAKIFARKEREAACLNATSKKERSKLFRAMAKGERESLWISIGSFEARTAFALGLDDDAYAALLEDLGPGARAIAYACAEPMPYVELRALQGCSGDLGACELDADAYEQLAALTPALVGTTHGIRRTSRGSRSIAAL